jgi:hypothetical protein
VLFVRAAAAAALARAAVEIIYELDPNLTGANVQTVDAAFGESVNRSD